MSKARTLPVLPLRELVVFPGQTIQLRVGREASLAALEVALGSTAQNLVLVSQVDRRTQDPGAGDVFTIGVLAQVRASGLSRKTNRRVHRIEVEILRRVRLLDLGCKDAGYYGRIEDVDEDRLALARSRELCQSILSKLNEINRFDRGRYPTAELLLEQDFSTLLDQVAGLIDLDVLARQELLEELDLEARAQGVLLALEVELATHRQRMQRAESARYQSRRADAGSPSRSEDDEVDELRAQVAETELSDEARDRVERELVRLERMHVMSAEANVLRNWVEQVLRVPWSRFTEDRLVLAHAAKLLDAEHHGLADPKDRILEYLAVRSQSPRASGPVLCLVGPPGVGKTSLARSVAGSMGREFVRVALGGVADESQIRGHRRTYVGAMPGRIIGALQRAQTMNPVLLLDELDKLDANLRGDPAAALLEVLDPEQNHAFRDHYLELGVDLSQVLFLCTANREDRLPTPLLDRLEVLRLSGYSEEEKVEIARRFLAPKRLLDAGFAPGQVTFTQSALVHAVRSYTRESGVRGLDRVLARCARRLTRECLEEQPDQVVSEAGSKRISASRLKRFLGPALPGRSPVHAAGVSGVSLGLSWSQVGGDVLRIEAVCIPGQGRLRCTGHLGDVMKESAELAFSFLRSQHSRLGEAGDRLADHDLHLHLPEGAQPKEGPSAGVAVALAMLSCLTGKPLPADLACTGELTLTGLVLPVGGLREKFLAAQRYGLKRVVYPAANQDQVDALPNTIKRSLELIPINSFSELAICIDFEAGTLNPCASTHVDA